MTSAVRFSSMYLGVPGAIKAETDGVRDFIENTSLSFTIGLDGDDALLVPRDDFRRFARPMTVNTGATKTTANAYDLTIFSNGHVRVNSTNPMYEDAPLTEANRGIHPNHWQGLATQLLLRLKQLRTKHAFQPGKDVAFFHPYPADAPLAEISPKPTTRFPTEAMFQAFAFKSAIDSSILRQTMLDAQERKVRARLGTLADHAFAPEELTT